MKQVKYTEKQLLVLEVLGEIDKFFKYKMSYDFQKKYYFESINKIKAKYGIKERYQTLREYISNCECGAYHNFIFDIGGKKINVIGVYDFERFYNSKLLDKYYVLKDNAKDNGGNCENYKCEHYLDIVEKED